MSDSNKIEIELNGESFSVETGCTINGLLSQLAKSSGSTPRKFEAVAVELNSEIVARDCFDKTTLSNGDAVEVVTLVGGG